MSGIELSIVIVNWNAGPHLTGCLQSIRQQLDEVRYEVIVVDNGSEDGSIEAIKHALPEARLIENQVNLGFAAANNQGFREARGAFVLMLNPDVLLGANAVQAMLAFLKRHPDAGLVGPRVIDGRGAVVRACRRGPISLGSILKGLFFTDRLLYRLLESLAGKAFVSRADARFYRSGETGCLQGSCMLARKRDLLDLGGFDERIPLFLDDGDLCFRMRQKGFSVYFLAEAEVVHFGGVSIGNMANSRMSSLVGSLALDVYFLKHHSALHVAAYHAMLFVSSVIFLIADFFLWIPCRFMDRRFIPQYAAKHFWSLVYSLTFRFKTDALPRHWPRSLAQAWHAPASPRS